MRGEKLAEPAPRLARLDEMAPAGHEALHRRERPAEDDGGGDHDARGQVLRDHEERAGAEHGELDELPRELGEAGKGSTDAVGAHLLAQRGVVEPRPAPRDRGQHAQRGDHLGVAHVGVDEAPRAPRFGLRALQRLAAQCLVQHRERDHQQGAAQRHHAQHRVEQKNDEHEHRQPRRVEYRKQPLPAEKAAQQVYVAQPIQMRRAAEPRRLREQPVQHPRPEPPVERHPGRHQQPPAQHLEERHHQQRDERRDREDEQRFLAAAGEHAIEHLQHVQRRREQEQVDRQAE
jgi:hypothetical protein